MSGGVWVVPVGEKTDAVVDEAHRVAELLGEVGDRPPVVVVGFGDPEAAAYESVPPDEAVGLVAETGAVRTSAATVTDRVRALAELAAERDPAVILTESTPDGDDLMTGFAGQVGGACVTNCLVRVRDGELLAGRRVYEGRAYAELDVDGTPALSVHTETLGTPEQRPSGPPETTTREIDGTGDGGVRHLTELEIPERDLSRAQTIVAGGRGLGGPDGFEPVRDLADAVGGALGASRPPADEGWVPYDRQIGVTGKEIEPELYVPCAISGDPYHMRSVTAEHLVPINRDSEARIFDFADLGIAGDVFEYAPAIAAAIRDARQQDSDQQSAVPDGGESEVQDD
jgi:electron transfer flavoprotein alpha subunit